MPEITLTATANATSQIAAASGRQSTFTISPQAKVTVQKAQDTTCSGPKHLTLPVCMAVNSLFDELGVDVRLSISVDHQPPVGLGGVESSVVASCVAAAGFATKQVILHWESGRK